jgi:hypothetical protein
LFVKLSDHLITIFQILEIAHICACVYQFAKGDVVKIKSIVDLEVVGLGTITGLPVHDNFHSVPIESPFVRLCVTDVIAPDVALPFPNREEGQRTLGDVKGVNTLWNSKYLRKC